MLLKYPNISYVSQGAHIAVEKSLENQEKVIFRARMCTRLKKKTIAEMKKLWLLFMIYTEQ